MRVETLLHLSQSTLLGSLGPTARNLAFRRRQIIYSVGDESDSIFLIKAGSVKLTAVSAEGNEAVTAILKDGELFGPEALDVNPSPRATNAVALTNVRLGKIERNTMLDLVLSDPTICMLFISSLIRQITRLQDELAGNLLYNSEQRLARTLLSLANFAKTHKQQYVPTLSQQELGNMIGATRQRVNVLLKQFRKLGYIHDARGKQINNSLQKIAGTNSVANRTR